LNGLAVDAATTVVWALVDRVRRTTTTTKTWLAEGDASMLIEVSHHCGEGCRRMLSVLNV
jgi:hypothetical protein